ncbi:MAG: cysteine--tRNA ligase [Candidatus Acetothermia bacterium]|jgi:cysteinyl-tRNA synthetase|nr:cysteine--tRNA ligase [Candidatus Acetothermia bacterium]MDH7505376.1 cysteine--tRNA ligase [Candidatus Acetothermia bacterium]
MRLYNTLTRREEEFVPQEAGVVRMYACGPTVHDRFTIANARAFLTFDVLRRYLEFKGYKVLYTQNITDIEDRIIKKGEALGSSAQEVAERYTQAFFEDRELLGILPPTYQPRATEMVPKIIEFIQGLLERGFAYVVDGDVYFRVRRFKDYGKLSGKNLEELAAGASGRVEPDPRKEDPLDFALWKVAKPGEPAWDSPWGKGRPGWHIECSVMAQATLGTTLDIHGGGQDLIFPHHENELAQSEALTGRPLARFWVHNGLVMAGGQEMHKSLGNFEYARDVVARHGREAVRLFFLLRHYRKPMDFSHKALAEAQAAVERVYNFLEEIEAQGALAPTRAEPRSPAEQEFSAYLATVRAEFEREMDADLNTAGALGVLFELVRRTNTFMQETAPHDRSLLRRAGELIRELGRPLGLFQEEPKVRAKVTLSGRARIIAGAEEEIIAGNVEELINLLVEVRGELRAKGEFALADRIRARLNELGIELRDKEGGTRWRLRLKGKEQ